ncbi:MAG: hypothetical protein Q9P14_16890 [candidate division KSB1 bacterium]|nr:hypothetical protein [candidate division KSB1 bacterium]MDQ7063667.1 hypothetical protein [candidate division KSB1 bacterium]
MFNKLEELVFLRIKAICEWLWERAKPCDEKGNPFEEVLEPFALDEIIQCLKRIIRSVPFWIREGGSKDNCLYPTVYPGMITGNADSRGIRSAGPGTNAPFRHETIEVAMANEKGT